MALVANTITTANTFAQYALDIRKIATESNRRQLDTLPANNVTVATGLNVSGNVIIAETKRLFLDTDKDTYIAATADDTMTIVANSQPVMNVHPNRQVTYYNHINMSGARVVFDTDKDTHVAATTDDTIVFTSNGATALTIHPNKLAAFTGNVALTQGKMLILDADRDSYIVATADDLLKLVANSQTRIIITNSRITVANADFKVDASKKLFLDTDNDTYLTSNNVDDTISVYANSQIAERVHPNKTLETFGPRKFRGQRIYLDLDNDTYIDVGTDDYMKFYSNGALRVELFPNGVLKANTGIQTPRISDGPLGGRRNYFYNSQFENWVNTTYNTESPNFITGPMGWLMTLNGLTTPASAGFSRVDLARTSGPVLGTVQDPKYAIRCTFGTSDSSSNNQLSLKTYVPCFETLYSAQKPITLSFYARCGGGITSETIGVNFYRHNDVGSANTVLNDARSSFLLSNTWQRYTKVFQTTAFPDLGSVSANTTQAWMFKWWFSAGSNYTTDAFNIAVNETGWVEIAAPQIEVGSYVTDYQPTYPELHWLQTRTFTATDLGVRLLNRTRAVEFMVQGGGGGGGGADGQGAGTAAGGGGGGGGGFVKSFYRDIDHNEDFEITVGSGGGGGSTAGGDGSAGSSSTVTDRASGGLSLTASNGAAGGGEVGGAGTTIVGGGSGGGFSATVYDWGRTGGAGISFVRIAGDRASGTMGGSSFFAGAIGTGPINAAGSNGGWYGGGGEGATSTDQTNNLGGGDGAAGVVIVTEYGEIFS